MVVKFADTQKDKETKDSKGPTKRDASSPPAAATAAANQVRYYYDERAHLFRSMVDTPFLNELYSNVSSRQLIIYSMFDDEVVISVAAAG